MQQAAEESSSEEESEEEEEEEEEESEEEPQELDLNTLKVVELKERLQKAGLKVDGKKSVLVERLTKAYSSRPALATVN